MSLPIVLLLLAVAAAAGWWFFLRKPSLPPPAPRVPDASAANWSLDQYAQGVALVPSPNGGVSFDFGPLPSQIHYMTTSVGGLRGTIGLTAAVRVETTGSPSFVALDGGQIDPTPGFPAKATLYMQRRGDDMSGKGEYEFYRWWNTEAAFVLAQGSATLIGALADPSKWISVYGADGGASPAARAGFAAAIADLDKVGLTFGGRFKGHGVALAPGDTGTARFFLDEFKAG